MYKGVGKLLGGVYCAYIQIARRTYMGVAHQTHTHTGRLDGSSTCAALLVLLGENRGAYILQPRDARRLRSLKPVREAAHEWLVVLTERMTQFPTENQIVLDALQVSTYFFRFFRVPIELRKSKGSFDHVLRLSHLLFCFHEHPFIEIKHTESIHISHGFRSLKALEQVPLSCPISRRELPHGFQIVLRASRWQSFCSKQINRILRLLDGQVCFTFIPITQRKIKMGYESE